MDISDLEILVKDNKVEILKLRKKVKALEDAD